MVGKVTDKHVFYFPNHLRMKSHLKYNGWILRFKIITITFRNCSEDIMTSLNKYYSHGFPSKTNM